MRIMSACPAAAVFDTEHLLFIYGQWDKIAIFLVLTPGSLLIVTMSEFRLASLSIFPVTLRFA